MWPTASTRAKPYRRDVLFSASVRFSQSINLPSAVSNKVRLAGLSLAPSTLPAKRSHRLLSAAVAASRVWIRALSTDSTKLWKSNRLGAPSTRRVWPP